VLSGRKKDKRAQLTRVHEFARIMEKKNGTKPKEEVKENA
jgi:hypothetical protein